MGEGLEEAEVRSQADRSDLYSWPHAVGKQQVNDMNGHTFFELIAQGTQGPEQYPGMLDTGTAFSLLTIMEIGGPIVLGLVLAYAMIRVRRRSRAQIDRTEAATRELYREGKGE